MKLKIFHRKRKSDPPHRLRIPLILASTLIVVLFPILALRLFRPQESKATWMDDAWAYRSPWSFTHNAALSNQRVSFTIANTNTLVSASKMLSTCNDVRFTDLNGKPLLIQLISGCNSASTVYDVVIPSVISGVNAGYVYYGNPAAQSASQTISSYTSLSPSGGAAAFSTEEKGTGPVAYWSFDDGTGTTAQDGTSNNNDGTLSGGTVWQAEDKCLSGKCLYFDGTDDNVNVADNSKIEFDYNQDFTISMWIRLPAAQSNTVATTNRIVQKASANYPYIFVLNNQTHGVNPNKIQVARWDGTAAPAIISTSTFNDNKWHFISFVKSSSTLYLYADGKQEGTTTDTTTTTTTNAATLYLGSGGGTNFPMQGYLDEVKEYNYGRSAAQIKTDYASRGGNKGSNTTQGTSNQKALSDGLVGYWKLDESATPALDSSGNGQSGTWNASPTSAAGKFSDSISLSSASSQYISVTDTSALSPTTAVSISAWINPTSSVASRSIVVKDSAYRMTTNASSQLVCEIYSGGSWQTAATGTTTLVVANWQHVACSYDRKTVNAFVNGALDGTSSVTLSLNDSASALEVGRNVSTNYFNGRIDDVRIYNRALSTNEIQQFYNFAPGPVGYWKFDDASGTSAADSSGNSYTATITDSGTAGGWTTGKFGKTYSMAANNDGDTINLSSSISLGTSNTLSLWVNFTSLGTNDSVIGGSPTGTTDGYMLYLDGTDVYSRQALASGVSVPGTFTNGTWYHLEVVRDGTAITFYKNGIQLGTTQTYGSNNPFTLKTLTNFDFGATTFALEGKIDDVRLYNYARTPAQVIEDMWAKGSSASGGNGSVLPTSYWDMDESSGTSAHDSSANANDLTLSAASWTNSGKTNGAWNGLGTNWLSRADDDDLDFAAADSFAISMWAKSYSASNPAATEYLLYKAPSGVSNGGYGIYVNTSGQYCFGIDDDNTSFPEDSSCSTSDFYDGNWHHIMATKTGTTKIQLFVDTKPQTVDSSLSATGTLANTSIIYLGDKDGVNNGDEYNGDLDEVKMYRSDLTGDQLALEYNSGAAVNYGSTATAESTQITGSAETTPINYWNFDERTGSTATDKGSGAKNGTISGNTAWATGKIGSGLKFDGASGVVAVGSFTPPTIMTFETWFYANSIGENSLGRIAEHTNFSLFTQASTILFQSTWSTPGKWTIPLPSLSAWHHLIVVYDSGSSSNTPTIYVDGIAQTVTNTQAASGSITLSSATLRIGNTSGDDRTFDGTLDDIKIFDYARTQAQAAYDFNRGGPVGWWQFDECSGTTAHDTSGKGNNATMTFAGGTYTQAGSCTSGTSSDAWYGGATGKFNSGMALDTNSDVIDIGNISTYAFERTNPFSVSIWLKTTNNTAMTLLAKQDSSAPFSGWSLQVGSSGLIYFDLVNTYSSNILEMRTNDTSYADGAWHHIVATYDGSSTPAGIHIYFDGKDQSLTTSFNSLSGSILNSIPVTIGSRNDTGQKYAGLLDDARIYNFALTASQVRKVMTGGSAIQFAPSSGQP